MPFAPRLTVLKLRRRNALKRLSLLRFIGNEPFRPAPRSPSSPDASPAPAGTVRLLPERSGSLPPVLPPGPAPSPPLRLAEVFSQPHTCRGAGVEVAPGCVPGRPPPRAHSDDHPAGPGFTGRPLCGQMRGLSPRGPQASCGDSAGVSLFHKCPLNAIPPRSRQMLLPLIRTTCPIPHRARSEPFPALSPTS